MYFSDAIRSRFFSKVTINGEDDCWPWLAGTTRDGYGLFGVKHGYVRTAHRYSKEMELGHAVSTDLDASHTCNRRDCVNPKHIVFETHTENMRRVPPERRWRGSDGFSKGHSGWGRKLSDDQVREIRASQDNDRVLSNRYAVSRFAIYQVVHRITYASVP